MSELEASFSLLKDQNVLIYVGRGVLFTLIISVIAVLLSILFGTVLAILRNYCNSGVGKIFRAFATFYIELFRNTPLLLWIFICVVFCPTPTFFSQKMFGLTSVESKLLWKAAVALVLFESSIIAEIIRGGLNSVAQGQFEAAYSQGFGTVKTFLLIILPQAFRSVVPTLLGQVISTIKDSSYLANVATIELMSRVKTILAVANRYTGQGNIHTSDVFVLFGLAAAIYFVINFTLSCIVRSMQGRRKRAARRDHAFA
ncbi:MAG: amino acid ABC transporter permease [Lachnospiraceae bacterium]|nr:amino acid ABC transporter permease [Lachnospiraceae bacterium]